MYELSKAPMTKFLQDILRQPTELKRVLEYLCRRDCPLSKTDVGTSRLDVPAAAVRTAEHVYLTGIGSSWHAALNVRAIFSAHGRPVYMQDAAELLQFATIPENSVIIVISRSGRSIEIVRLLAKARKSGAKVIGITNAADGSLAREAQYPIVVPVELDHAISVNTYTSLALAAGILAASVVGIFDETLATALSRSIADVGRAAPEWREEPAESAWLRPGSTTYFLARGASLGSAYEARVMWGERVESPATPMGAGGFRQRTAANGGLSEGAAPL